jgi:hypothetical protein
MVEGVYIEPGQQIQLQSDQAPTVVVNFENLFELSKSDYNLSLCDNDELAISIDMDNISNKDILTRKRSRRADIEERYYFTFFCLNWVNSQHLGMEGKIQIWEKPWSQEVSFAIFCIPLPFLFQAVTKMNYLMF